MSDFQREIADAIAAFRKYDFRAITGVEKTIKRYALLVEGAAKRSFKGRDAPSVYNEPPRVDTGRLRASITHRSVRSSAGEYSQEIGTNVEYAEDVELGTSETMPHPFLGYAFGMYEREIDKAIEEAINEAADA